MNRRLLFLILLTLSCGSLLALALRTSGPRRLHSLLVQTTPPTAKPSPGLSAMLPPGALLTIESPDFAGLLADWTSSPESASWLHSASYSVFSNSRLFGRLSAAQDEFASTARLASAGTTLLQQVAGKESIFAWYDIGSLQFLYITRMPANRAEQSALFSRRAGFERRQVGSSAFYVRSETPAGSSQRRTVAFASVGGMLLLSTREDLMAGALNLIANPATGSESLAAEPWYAEARAAQPAGAATSDLHMVLDLERILRTPYFRSYWVQQNISDLKQYRSAVSDLHRDQSPAGLRFREERTLIPLAASAAAPGSAPEEADLGGLAALVPPGTGVFRATATTDGVAAVATLNEKLLTRAENAAAPGKDAPNPDLQQAHAGDAADLETRIDTPAPLSASASTAALAQLLGSSGLEAVLTLDTAQTVPGIWIPLHAAVVLRTAHSLEPAALADSLQQALRGSLTASTLGIDLHTVPGNPAILTLSGPKSLFFSQSADAAGALTLFSDDLPILKAILDRESAAPSVKAQRARFLGGADFSSQRLPYERVTRLIDAPGTPASSGPSADTTAVPPAFFSGNIRSLSDAFSRVRSEQVLVYQDGANLHQTVLYQWQP